MSDMFKESCSIQPPWERMPLYTEKHWHRWSETHPDKIVFSWRWSCLGLMVYCGYSLCFLSTKQHGRSASCNTHLRGGGCLLGISKMFEPWLLDKANINVESHYIFRVFMEGRMPEGKQRNPSSPNAVNAGFSLLVISVALVLFAVICICIAMFFSVSLHKK